MVNSSLPLPAAWSEPVPRKPRTKSSPPAKGRSRERGDTVTFTFEMTPELDDSLESCSRAEDRTKKAILTRALVAYLKSAGYYHAGDKAGCRES